MNDDLDDLIEIGDTVECDGDRGLVIESYPIDDLDVPHAADAVLVSWRSGVRTWTPRSELTVV